MNQSSKRKKKKKKTKQKNFESIGLTEFSFNFFSFRCTFSCTFLLPQNTLCVDRIGVVRSAQHNFSLHSHDLFVSIKRRHSSCFPTSNWVGAKKKKNIDEEKRKLINCNQLCVCVRVSRLALSSIVWIRFERNWFRWWCMCAPVFFFLFRLLVLIHLLCSISGCCRRRRRRGDNEKSRSDDVEAANEEIQLQVVNYAQKSKRQNEPIGERPRVWERERDECVRRNFQWK